MIKESKLFLTSGFFRPQTKRYFTEQFLPKPPTEMTIGFIPTAADPEDDKWFIDKSRQDFVDLGFKIKDIDLKDLKPNTIIDSFKNIDVIYFNGGNTYYLLYWIRKSGFDKEVEKLLKMGKIYMGTSAGSIVAGPNIGLAGWEPNEDVNGIKLEDLTGLNLVDFAIYPHYDPTDENHIKRVPEQKKSFPYKVIVLTDEQTVAVNNGSYEIIGPGKKIILE